MSLFGHWKEKETTMSPPWRGKEKGFLNKGFIKKTLTGDDVAAPDLFKLESKYVYVFEKYIGNNSLEEIEKTYSLSLCNGKEVLDI